MVIVRISKSSAGGAHAYSVKFQSKEGYATVRLPFDTFLPRSDSDPPLDPGESFY
jgi:hypothetical protein